MGYILRESECVFFSAFAGALGWSKVKPVEKKLLSCVFLRDVLCAFRKSERSYVMERCSTCEHYKRFEREMEEEEDEFFAEAEKIWKYGYPKKFDVPEGGS